MVTGLVLCFHIVTWLPAHDESSTFVQDSFVHLAVYLGHLTSVKAVVVPLKW